MLEALAKEPMGTIRNALVDEERGTGGQFGRLHKEFRERADIGPVSLHGSFLTWRIALAGLPLLRLTQPDSLCPFWGPLVVQCADLL
jgi:hypothetical protein